MMDMSGIPRAESSWWEVNGLTIPKTPEDKYIKRVYRQIIALALVMHISYVGIFALLGLPALAAYNVGSVLFYIAMQAAVGRGYYRLTVSCIHIEVCIFVTVTVLLAGWGVGSAFYLVAMTSLTYFCPFQRKYIPYLFAGLEICVFLALRLYTRLVCPNFLAVSEKAGLALYIYSVCSCFTIMIYAAFLSKVSAAVSQQQLQDENRSLTVLANYDQLTGLLSRRAFLEKLEKLKGSPLILALGDIDDFKMVNDTWGHLCGDQVLSETAELFRQLLNGEADVCRWGGEEFVFLFRELPLKEATARVQVLCDTVARHTYRFEGDSLHITMTFGVCETTEETTADELVAMADQRMYKGKALGKNQVIY